MPFVEAAELGTHKVIHEHATIGMMVTTDGSIGEIARASYVAAEERIVGELKALGKPFAVILNTADPSSERAIQLAYELEAKYDVPVALVNCLDLNSEDIRHILEMVLHEFPVREIAVTLPAWTEALEPSHRIRRSLESAVCQCAQGVRRAGDIEPCFAPLRENEYVGEATVDEVDLGSGRAHVTVTPPEGLIYRVMSEMTGFEVDGETALLRLLCSLSEMKREYDKVADALRSANESGYGIVMPEVQDLHLEEPEIVKQAGGYGVRLRAAAQSIHMIRANIETEINPIVGTEQRSEDLINYMMKEFESDPTSIWRSNLFGKTLYELVNEGLHAKLDHMPADSRERLSGTLERIINEGSNGLICILL